MGGIGTYDDHISRLLAKSGKTIYIVGQMRPGAEKDLRASWQFIDKVDDDARNDTTPEITDGSSMSCRLFRKAIQQDRSERRGESYSVPYVEPLSEGENDAGGLC